MFDVLYRNSYKINFAIYKGSTKSDLAVWVTPVALTVVIL
jgi:hypothetical protein